MFKTFYEDKEFIKDKYHKTSEPYDAYNRFGYIGWEPNNGTGLSDEEMDAELDRLSVLQKDMPHPVSKANAFKLVCEKSIIDINEHDYFIHFYSWRRPLKKSFFDNLQKQSFDKLGDSLKIMEDYNQSGACAIWADYDHVIPNWDDLLSLGYIGLIERVEAYRSKKSGSLTEEMNAFYEGIIIEYNAILGLLDRYIAYGEAHPNAKTEKVVSCLKHIRYGVPTDIYEALQAMYIYFIACECIDNYQTRSIGNGFDSTLYRFYKNDLESGRYSVDEIREFIAYFFMQFAAIDNYWGHPMYFGGTDINGNTLYNELSMLCLDLYDELGFHTPKFQLKVNTNTPDEILNKAFEMVRRCNSGIVFNCEPNMIKAIATYGVPFDEAYDYEISGCYESRVKHNESSTSCGYVNALKALRYVFTDGFDETLNKQVGIHTGDLSLITSFTDFYSAFIRQMQSIIENVIEIANKFEADLAWVSPSNMFSGTIVSSLESGRDGYHNGMKYCNSFIHCCSFASTVDSLVAVKEFVYDKKEITLSELAKALEANWVGYELLRTKIKHSGKKYGNNIPEVDRYAQAIASWFTATVNNRKNVRGGVYKSILHSAMMFVWQGEKTGATPDGRKAGEEVSKNASPSIGMDREGVTAVINSATSLSPTSFPESFCLDLMMHPTSVSGDEGLVILKSLLMTYLQKGGQSLQFNILDVEMLRDAQLHPEKYQNLQVRICGWNILWNNIPKAQQDAYIERAESLSLTV